ncbi:MAG: marine proteobacterial sortase target protein, partial [Gammaproteobacteria bacterium]|nr:marine proteobacterial sortase target protein [Gammaproteobacteria bacterium]
MNHTHQAHINVQVKASGKPNIAKDAFVGLMTAIGIGLIASLVFVSIVFMLSSTAFAYPQTPTPGPAEAGLSDVHQGSLLFRTGKRGVFHIAPTVDTNVEMTVSGMVVRSKVVQTFKNPDDFWVEGVYVFPLPDNAAVDHMRMKIGERIVEGEIKEREEAKKAYTQAKQEGKKAALTDQERPNVFTNSVANIGPYESVTIEIEYQQTVQYEQQQGQGKFDIRFPLTMTPRYITGIPKDLQHQQQQDQQEEEEGYYQPVRYQPAQYQPVQYKETIESFSGTGWAMDTGAVPDASRVTPPVYAPEYAQINNTNPVTIKVDLNAGFPINQINSPYHDIQTAHQAEGHAIIQLAQGSMPANRDFNLTWTIDSGYSPKAALFSEEVKVSEEVDGEMYNLIMVMPPTDGIPGNQHLAREVTYIIDTSGSMGGTSIIQAKAALKMALSRLLSIDTFNVIQFNSVTDTLFRQAQIASQSNVNHALSYVDSLYATGGTEMYSAIARALDQASDEERVRQIIFLTDGSVGNEAQLFELIKQKLSNSRLFTVGIGSAPNSYFMTRAAEYGRGTYTFIGSTDEVQSKMQELFAKLETPVLTDVKVKFPDNVTVEMWPNRIPDLYLGEPIILVAKTSVVKAANFTGKVHISGQRANSIWEIELPLAGGRQRIGVAPLWARAKIKALMDSLAEGADKDAVKNDVIKVALQHHLVSKYTSLVAVEKTPSRPLWESLSKRAVPNNLPYGSTMGQQVVGSLAQTATDGQLKLLIGLLLLTFSLIAVWRMNR